MPTFKTVKFDLSPEEHRQLKSSAALLGRTMRELLREAVSNINRAAQAKPTEPQTNPRPSR